MARPKKDAAIDLSQSHELTAGLIERLSCPPEKAQAFLRDVKAPGLRVRVTPTGAKSFVYEAKLHRQTIRRTLGDVRNWSLEQARAEARRLAVVMDGGEDPRELERQHREATAAAAAETAARELALKQAEKIAALTVGDAWSDYLAKRRPFWGELHYRDHVDKSSSGGQPSKRRGAKGQLTQPGPLAPLMGLPLKDLSTAKITEWATHEGKFRPTSARLAHRLLTVFLSWCREQPEYSSLVQDNPAKTRATREALGRTSEKKDVLQRGQLAAWFEHVRRLQNPVVSTYLQTLLLTGARPGEVLALRWEDVNTQWSGLRIRDKVEGEREIPLTHYVSHLLTALPRRNEWVFSSARELRMDEHNIERRARKALSARKEIDQGPYVETSNSGHIIRPNIAHSRACTAAGLGNLTLHGLRRSFKSLTEWLEVPVGVVAQIQGHKPSATAEKHYTVRPLELLALHHQRIEQWVLEQAGVNFVYPKKAPDDSASLPQQP